MNASEITIMKARLILTTRPWHPHRCRCCRPRRVNRRAIPLTVVDDAGNAVVLAAAPVRIVSQTLATDEILLSLVDMSRIVAVTTFAVDNQISNVADLAAAVPRKLTQNVETIISLKPDLVLVANWSDPAPVKQMREAGVPVYLMASGVSVSSIEEKIEKLAMMTDEEEKGRQIIARMEERLGAVSEKVSRLSPRNACAGDGLCHVGLGTGQGQLLGRNRPPRGTRGRRGRARAGRLGTGPPFEGKGPPDRP